ncbi:MAG: AraC family transcriptional regulator [Arenicella sp.]|nr:AraC family transcriptional regulator [Arenicella sp.]
MDALSHILKIIQLSAKAYICQGIGAPWNLQFMYRPQGIFHIVMQGQCYLREGNSDEVILLQTGDGVGFPTGGVHWISDSPRSQNLPAEDVVNVTGDKELFLLKSGEVTAFAADSSRWGNNSQPVPLPYSDSPKGSQETILLSVTVSYDSSVEHPFLRNLPCFMHVNPSSYGDLYLHRQEVLTNLLLEESSASYPGNPLIVNHLTEVLFIQTLRVHMRKMKHSNGYMAALSDPRIGVALNLIHTETNEKWTVEALSRASAMGRTAFTQKFVDMVGDTPKSYLTSTRLMKAKSKLQNCNDPMVSIAESAGYASEAAFGKAIKQHFNTTPGELRKK